MRSQSWPAKKECGPPIVKGSETTRLSTEAIFIPGVLPARLGFLQPLVDTS